MQQGLLPAPFGAGGSAKYGEEHILRLTLIREMQNSHLKLTGIKEALDAMSIEEMKDLARKTGGLNMTWDPQSVERWVAHTSQDKDVVRNEEPKAIYSESPAAMEVKEDSAGFSFLDALDKARSRDWVQRKESQGRPASRPMGKESMGEAVRWERISLADGIELHIRSDRHDRSRSKIVRLIDYCRKLF